MRSHRNTPFKILDNCLCKDDIKKTLFYGPNFFSLPFVVPEVPVGHRSLSNPHFGLSFGCDPPGHIIFSPSLMLNSRLKWLSLLYRIVKSPTAFIKAWSRLAFFGQFSSSCKKQKKKKKRSEGKDTWAVKTGQDSRVIIVHSCTVALLISPISMGNKDRVAQSTNSSIAQSFGSVKGIERSWWNLCYNPSVYIYNCLLTKL